MRFRFLILERIFIPIFTILSPSPVVSTFLGSNGRACRTGLAPRMPAPRTISVGCDPEDLEMVPYCSGGRRHWSMERRFSCSDPARKRLVRDLWTLYPTVYRQENAWPSTFAFSSELGFDVLVMPVLPEKWIPGYLSEDQTRLSRKSIRAQLASCHRIRGCRCRRALWRETTSDMIRFALRLLAAMMVFAVIAKLLFH